VSQLVTVVGRMPFADLQAFLAHLEATRQLQRVRVEVDPVLEGPVRLPSACCAMAVPRTAVWSGRKARSVPLVMNLSARWTVCAPPSDASPEGIGVELVAGGSAV
jgi:hypothetical protein